MLNLSTKVKLSVLIVLVVACSAWADENTLKQVETKRDQSIIDIDLKKNFTLRHSSGSTLEVPTLLSHDSDHPSEGNVIVLTDSSQPLNLSVGDYTVYGSPGGNIINLESGCRVQCLHFTGSNQINIDEASSQFNVYRSGANVILSSDAGTFVKLPATTTPQSIIFQDATLQLVTTSERIMIGEQEVTRSTAPLDTTPVATIGSISGTITAAGGSFCDSDVNDPRSTYSANDTIDLAQDISNPAVVGGYVNEPFTGKDGRSYLLGDEYDCYHVDLMAGDTIFLSISDYHETDVDIDLYLLDDAGNTIDSSMGLSDAESLVINMSGSYIIVVEAYAGASNYVLSIGQSSTNISGNMAQDSLRLSHDFIPGELIVKFKDSAARAMAAGAVNTVKAISENIGLQYKAGDVNREMLMTLGNEAQTINTFKKLGVTKRFKQIQNMSRNKSQTTETEDLIQKKLDTLKIIKALRKREDIAYADLNYKRKINFTPNDTHYPYQWHYPLIHLPDAWEITRGSSDVVVAVIDTGIILDHPDLQTNLTHNGMAGDGYDFITDTATALDGDGIDPNPYDVGDQANAGNSSFHGTHVAGTIAAGTDNSIGITGVAGNTRIMPLRVLGKNGGTDYDITQAVRYAAGLPNDSNTLPSKKADIINLSLGGAGYSSSAQQTYTAARNAGVIIIAAAGNESTWQPSYPASYDGVVSVSAVDMNSDLAPYSNYGQYIDVAAPGGDTTQDLNRDGYPDGVLSTLGTTDSTGNIVPNYVFYQGTSMAAPHVAGVAAMMKAVDTDITPFDFDGYLSNFKIVNDIGQSGRDNYYGFGIIDALKAVETAMDDTPVASSLQVFPETLDFGVAAKSTSLTVSAMGSGTVSVTNVTSTAPWLTVTGTDTDNNGLGYYDVRIDRIGLSSGRYDAQINFTGSTNTVTIPVSMQVDLTPQYSDTGLHYILLLDADTHETIEQKSVEAVDGKYTYSFNELTSGSRYLICAGTDFDNDWAIGDSGESFGIYPTSGQAVEITVNGDIMDIDFVIGFNIVIPEASVAGFKQPDTEQEEYHDYIRRIE